jgi:HAD superfamily hydrolase (TIGR01509 family)
MTLHTIQLVAFDIGGVLIRICRSWKQVFELAGIPWNPSFGSEEAVQWNQLYESGQITTDQLVQHFATLAADLSAEQLLTLIDQWLIEPYPGTAQLIDQLNTAGVPTACLSNTNERHWQTMATTARFAAIQALNTQIASHLVQVMKPKPGIYEALERETGLSGASILYFDDFDINITAALDRGWHAYRIDHAADTTAQMTQHLREHQVI